MARLVDPTTSEVIVRGGFDDDVLLVSARQGEVHPILHSIAKHILTYLYLADQQDRRAPGTSPLLSSLSNHPVMIRREVDQRAGQAEPGRLNPGLARSKAKRPAPYRILFLHPLPSKLHLLTGRFCTPM